MRDVYDFAKYFIKNNVDSFPNTFDGNMKLQKMLVFANLISISEYNELLFDEQILAFENGCVVEKIRLRYKNDYISFKDDSDRYEPDFSEKEYDILRLTTEIFGKASARELSDINHTFAFWKDAYVKGTDSNGYHDKNNSIVNILFDSEDIKKVHEIVSAYKEVMENVSAKELINGVTFYYDDLILTDQIINELEKFSLTADDDTYSVYVDSGKLVIY